MFYSLGPKGVGDIENINMSRKENWLGGRRGIILYHCPLAPSIS